MSIRSENLMLLLRWPLALLLGGLMLGSAAAQDGAGTGPAWTSLSPAQQHALAPLSAQWSNLDAERKKKWLELAARYPALPAEQQGRLQQRMTEWARLTPEQRGQARLNFQQAQQVPPTNRQAQWEAYKALPKEQKDALARRASAAASAPGQAQASRSLRAAPLDAQAPKTNTVASAPQSAQAARVVAPTLVQTGPGASTRLVTVTPPKPPQHQAQGGPKIDVRTSSVDRSTLLPKRAVAAAPAPASQPAGVP